MARARLVFMLLVVLLLPVRGALAAMGLLCHVTPSSTHAAVQHSSHGVHHAAVHVHSHHDAAWAQQAHDDQGDRSADDTCNLCSAVCSTPPLATAAVQVPPASAGRALPFPPVDLTRLSYVTDGLERPPRTI